MRRLLIVIICIFSLSTITLYTQETETQIIIRISYTTNDTVTDFAEIFLDDLATELASYNRAIEFVDSVDDAHMDLHFNTTLNDPALPQGIVVLTHLQTNPLTNLSSILYKSLDPIIGTRADEVYSVDFITALILYMTDDCETANAIFNDMLETYPEANTRYIHFTLGNCHLLQGEYSTAITHFSEVYLTSFDSFLYPPTTNAAWAYIQLEHEDEAFDLMQLVIESDRYFGYIPVETLTNRAQLYALVLDYDLAIADMDTAITLAEENPNNFTSTDIAELYVLRGQMVILLYEWDRVLENYNTALEIDADYTPAYYFRGILYYSVLAREEALSDFEAYLEQEPEGDYASQAQAYAESIRTELDALDD